MSSKHSSKNHHPYCLNCHYPLSEFDKNCSQCGQKPTDGKVTLHDLLHEFTHTLFHIDGKFFSTLKHLFIPGKLTLEFFKGHHKRYAHPVQLYIVLGALFLIVMNKLLSSAEDDLRERLAKNEAKTVKKKFLVQLDSSANTLASYNTTPSVKLAVDSLLERAYISMSLRNEDELVNDYVKTKKNLTEQKFKVNYFYSRVNFDTTLDKGKKLSLKFKDYEADLDELLIDSMDIVEQYGKLKQMSNSLASTSLETTFVITVMNEKKDRNKPKFNIETETKETKPIFNIIRTVDDEKELKEVVNNHIEKILGSDTTYFYKKGNEKYDFEKRTTIISLQNKKISKRDFKIELDSITEVSTKVAVEDINQLSADELIEKYKVEGFFNKLIFKATINFRKNGADKFHAFIGKSVWIVTFTILPMAGFMWLMYRRQKRYYVEHVVWLIHLSCLMFILFAALLIPKFIDGVDSNIITSLFTMALFLIPLIGMKVYYQQSWRKTILKGFIFNMVYYFIALIVFVLGGIITFLFL